MRMLIVGAGAIGGYYGARLAKAGRDVTFLVHPRRLERLNKNGIQVKSPLGDVAISPKLVTAGNLGGTYDVILLAVKAYSLDAVMADMANAVGPATIILPVLNGMKHMDTLAARFGQTAVAGGACKISVDQDADGVITHMNPLEEIAFGEMDGSTSARIQALDGFLQNAGINARLSPTIAREMWEKWTLLAALGGINALMRGTIGEVEAATGGTAFASAYLDEIIAVVSAAGIAPSPAFVPFARGMLLAKGSPMTSSMYRDLQKGGRIEADQIVGDLLARAARVGVAAPLTGAVYANLCVYQNRLG